LGFILEPNQLLELFEVDKDTVRKIVSFLSSKATRKLRSRKEILIDTVTLLYSIPKTCEVRGDNPLRVVSHLRMYLPHNLFFDDDINYEYYPEMVLAVSQVYAKEFRPSRKLLVMAYLARIVSNEIREVIYQNENYPLFWAKTPLEFFRLLYDLKIEVKRERSASFPIRVSVPKFVVALILDADKTSQDFLDKIMLFSDFVILIVVDEEKTKVYYPEGLDAGKIEDALSKIMEVHLAQFRKSEENLKLIADSLKQIFMEKAPSTWRLGSFLYDVLRIDPEFTKLLRNLGLYLDYTFTIADKPEIYAPTISAICTALKHIGKIAVRGELPKEKMVVEEASVKTHIVAPSPPPLRFEKATYSASLPKEAFEYYVAEKALRRVLGASIEVSDIDPNLIAIYKVLAEIFNSIQHESLRWLMKITKEGKTIALIHFMKEVDGWWCALMEIRTEVENIGEATWRRVGVGMYAVRTMWDTAMLLLIAKSKEELVGKINKAITLSEQLDLPQLTVSFDDCDVYVEDIACTLREALILIETQKWCKGNFIKIENRSNETIQLMRVDKDTYILDVPVKTSEKVEIHRATIPLEKTRRILIDFAYGEEWRKHCDLKLAFILKQNAV